MTTLNQKGAIELSINMMVVIILSLVIVGSGVTLLYKFIGSATDIQTDLDGQTQQEIERILIDEGRQTAMPIQTKIGEAGGNLLFGLGIRNTLDTEQTFTIQVTFDRMTTPLGEMYTSDDDQATKDFIGTDPSDWFLYNDQPITLQSGEYNKEGINAAIPKDAPKGEYVFKAKVTDNLGDPYGRTQPFTIQIK